MDYTGRERCCLCGGALWDGESSWKGGNNAAPLSDGRCCNACNEIVIEARMFSKTLSDEIVRVTQAIMNVTNYSGDMARKAAMAAICASRGPALLENRRKNAIASTERRKG